MSIREQLRRISYLIGGLVLIGTVAGVEVSESATYYVAKSGKDSYSCAQATSASTPKLTLSGSSGGLRCLKAGDTLLIKGGTYAEVFNAYQIPAGTSWSAPVTLRAASDETVVIRPNSGGKNGDILVLTSGSGGTAQYIIFDGLIFDGTNVATHGVRLAGSAHHIRFVNGTIRNARRANCVFVQDSTTRYIEFRHMTIHNCGDSNQDHGLYVRGQNVRIEDSRIYNHSGFGVHVYRSDGQAHNNIVRNNEVFNNGAWGILIGSGQNNLAYNNIVRHNGKEYNGGGIRIGYYGPVSNQVYNNTVYANANACIMVNAGSSKTVVRNNLCWQNKSNMVRNDGSGSVISNTLTSDPQFVDPSTNNFRLRSGSPAIDRGLKLSQVADDYAGMGRPRGVSHDIGAYEYVSSTSSTHLVGPTNLRMMGVQ
jgi:parallel beta-helix repeat protein